MFTQSIATGCIQDRLWCVLSLLQKLMDSAADIFPGQKCFVFGVVPNRISNGDLHRGFDCPNLLFHSRQTGQRKSRGNFFLCFAQILFGCVSG